MEWSEERNKLLAELWGNGHSVVSIAAQFGLKSSDSIYRQVKRLELPPRNLHKSKIRRPLLEDWERTLLEDREDEKPKCQWPIGDPGEKKFHYCGQEATLGKPYCKDHCRKAYRKSAGTFVPTNNGAARFGYDG